MDNEKKINEKEKRVYEIFKNICADYDRLNDIISFRRHRKWKAMLAGEVAANNCRMILDLCCGTGDMSFLIAERIPQAMVVGVDFSPRMLEIARRRLSEACIENVELMEGNAMNLDFSDNSFDCAVISFGLRNVPDCRRVVEEMKRVVKPGGFVYCLDSSHPENPFVIPFYKIYFKYIVPLLGKVFAGRQEEYSWLNRSTELFLTKAELKKLFEDAGLYDVSYKAYMFGASACHVGRKPFSNPASVLK
jgi:demethylmenaquinone methyltransferase/2-methoxy-6-polyprenyl-1,4-benzoquinol methylase